MLTDRGRLTVHAGGWSLILGAVAFMAVFSYLAARFDYPAILDGSAETVLPRLLATGSTGRAIWALYAFLPLIWIPAGVGAHLALRRSHPGSSLLALQCAVVAALAMMLGLMRWPTIHWRVAELYAEADSSQRAVLDALFDGLNTYLGNYLGEFLGELAFNAFFLLTGWALLRTHRVAVLGLVAGLAGLVGMFRNVTAAVAPIAAVNNYLLPAWMIVFGAILSRWREPMESEA
ncbi:MAG TPA: DUF4386 domain-containing protein [Gemmatimonadales bacterium]|jgi:hypothetical protein|nr:DUF4386 domain-containing protein [Gemmatimonadales bacterium]